MKRTKDAARTVKYAPDRLCARVRADQLGVDIDHLDRSLDEPARREFRWAGRFIRSMVDSLFSLEQTGERLATVAHRRAAGKTIIQVA
ncbi:hypothetical protein [Rhodococcus sp. SJ-3]|uniref:hypothetical protein n=1 Tax=Rhodococcus sp. SJ-3 TaxID=3454628 RepID=UPI003F79E6FB